MEYILWLSRKELFGRKSAFFFNVALVCLAICFCVVVELISHSREQAVKSQLYHIDASVKIFPINITQAKLLHERDTPLIDQKNVLDIENRYRRWIRDISGRLILTRHTNLGDVLIIGYDPEKMITSFQDLKKLSRTEAVVGSAVAQKYSVVVGSHITIGDTDYRVKAINPATASFEDAAVYILLASLQDFTRNKRAINEISLYVRTGMSVDELIAVLRDDQPDFNIVKINSGEVAGGTMEARLKNYRVLLYGITGFIVICSLFISAFLNAQERKLELATLYSIGASRWDVVVLLSVRSVIVSVLGAVIGCILGIFYVLLQDYDSARELVTAWNLYSAAISAAVAASLLATLPIAISSSSQAHVEILQEAQQ